MQTIVVTAHLSYAGVFWPYGGPTLDGLLAAAHARKTNMDPTKMEPIELPMLARHESDRFYLASGPVYQRAETELQYTNRKFPIPEAQMFAEPKFKRINVSAGAQKSYRLPREIIYPKDGVVYWFAVGEIEGVRSLLAWVEYLGKRRAVGLGRVERWEVSGAIAWDGFPLLCDGIPLRPLPFDMFESQVSHVVTDGMAPISDPLRGVPSWHHHLQERAWLPNYGVGLV